MYIYIYIYIYLTYCKNMKIYYLVSFLMENHLRNSNISHFFIIIMTLIL